MIKDESDRSAQREGDVHEEDVVKPHARRVRFRIVSLKPFTYSVMHLAVAVAVAFALTRDWRIALGVGIVEPLVQTVAYTIHEALWSKSLARRSQASV